MLDNILTSAFVTSVLLGLGGFLGKIWINRIREKDRKIYEREIGSIKKTLEMTLHADKSIFEKEFGACEETWNSLLKFKTEVAFIKRDFEKKEDIRPQLEKCFEQHLKTHDLLYNNAPFVPECIRDEFFELAYCLQSIYQNVQETINEDSFTSDFLSLYEEQNLKVNTSIEKLEKLIRKRYVQPQL